MNRAPNLALGLTILGGACGILSFWTNYNLALASYQKPLHVLSIAFFAFAGVILAEQKGYRGVLGGALGAMANLLGILVLLLLPNRGGTQGEIRFPKPVVGVVLALVVSPLVVWLWLFTIGLRNPLAWIARPTAPPSPSPSTDRTPMPGPAVIATRETPAGVFTILQISDETPGGDDRDPQINDKGHVVFLRLQLPPAAGDLYRFDGRKVKRLTDSGNVRFFSEPYRPESSPFDLNNAGQVAWLEQRPGAQRRDVFLYDGQTTKQVTRTDQDESDLHMNDRGQLVWCARRGDRATEVFLYDGTQILQITDDVVEDAAPQMNSRGQVVWNTSAENADEEVLLYDGKTIRPLTDNACPDFSPWIDDHGGVAWFGCLDGSKRTVPTRLVAGQPVPLTRKGWSHRNLHGNARGQLAWEQHDGEDWEIFLLDQDRLIQVTDNNQDDDQCRLGENGEIVWRHDNQIWLYDGRVASPLTSESDAFCDNASPAISDRGDVVWTARRRSDRWVFLATRHPEFYGVASGAKDAAPLPAGSAEILTAPLQERDIPLTGSHSRIVTPLTQGNTGSRDFWINSSQQVVWSRLVEGRTGSFLHDGKSVVPLGDAATEDLEGRPMLDDHGRVVWEARQANRWRLFLRDGDGVRVLAENQSRFPGLCMNGQGRIAWIAQTRRSQEVFLFDGEHTIQVTNNADDEQQLTLTPGGDLVWVVDHSIYVFDGVPRLLVGEPAERAIQLIVASSREHVAWETAEAYGSGASVFLFDGRKVHRVTTFNRGSCDYESLQINSQGQLVWSKRGDPYLYDAGKLTRLGDHAAGDNAEPRINSLGQVVWTGDERVFLYDGSDVLQLSPSGPRGHTGCCPRINDRGWVTWAGHDGSDWEVFVYDGARVIQLSDNSEEDWYPQIDERGNVYWYRGGHERGDLVVAKPGLEAPPEHSEATPQPDDLRRSDGGGSHQLSPAIRQETVAPRPKEAATPTRDR